MRRGVFYGWLAVAGAAVVVLVTAGVRAVAAELIAVSRFDALAIRRPRRDAADPAPAAHVAVRGMTKRKRSTSQTLGGIIVGFDYQVFRTTPPPHELVAARTPGPA